MRIAVFAAVLALMPAVARAELKVSMHDGRVSVTASDVTVRQILAEWARVGQTKIVNGESVPGGPVTLQLTDIPEEQALDILLRSASGYLAAPRANASVDNSRFDRIIVMPTSTPSRANTTVARPSIARAPVLNDQDDDFQRNGPPPPAPPLSQQLAQPGGQGGVFNTYPQAIMPPNAAPAVASPVATPMPSAPIGVSVPGMVVPTPQPSAPGVPPQAR
jgi:hypothetical protein